MFSQDGSKIVFVQNTPGSKRLVEVTIATKKMRVLYDPKKIGVNLFGLCKSNGGVAFVEQYQDRRSLKILDVNARSMRTLHDNISVSRLHQTQFGVLMASSESGVENLYLVSDVASGAKPEKSRALTNSITRVMDGDLNPVDGSLVFSEQTADGIKLKKVTKKRTGRASRARRRCRPY